MLKRLKWIYLNWHNPIAYFAGSVKLRVEYFNLLGKYCWLKHDYKELKNKISN
jgi:hypothetical protein